MVLQWSVDTAAEATSVIQAIRIGELLAGQSCMADSTVEAETKMIQVCSFTADHGRQCERQIKVLWLWLLLVPCKVRCMHTTSVLKYSILYLHICILLYSNSNLLQRSHAIA